MTKEERARVGFARQARNAASAGVIVGVFALSGCSVPLVFGDAGGNDGGLTATDLCVPTATICTSSTQMQVCGSNWQWAPATCAGTCVGAVGVVGGKCELAATDPPADPPAAPVAPPADPPASPDPPAPTITYNDMTDMSLWSSFDIKSVDVNATGFHGGTFDRSRYIYLAPWQDGRKVTRLDTQGDFKSADSWSVYDAGLYGFFGAVFDGRHVYLVPNTSGNVVQYDTLGGFTDGASWLTFNTATLPGAPGGFIGSAFDGRYVYFVPNYTDAAGIIIGIVTRLDTQGSFTSAASWATFDTTTVNAGAKGFAGAAFDGRYLYLAPYSDNPQAIPNGTVTRYDTQADFGTAAAWTTFDVSTVNVNAVGYAGATFDGRHITFMPSDGNTNVAAQYDTQGQFSAASSWATFDTRTVNANAQGLAASVFDGRYVYGAPYNATGTVARFDTLGTFSLDASWSTFETTSINASANAFIGAVTDGQYVYFVPYYGVIARFTAKTTAYLPPGTPSFM